MKSNSDKIDELLDSVGGVNSKLAVLVELNQRHDGSLYDPVHGVVPRVQIIETSARVSIKFISVISTVIGALMGSIASIVAQKFLT